MTELEYQKIRVLLREYLWDSTLSRPKEVKLLSCPKLQELERRIEELEKEKRYAR